MQINFKKGFTLIELLVVVAIIALLASIVLAALNSARGKGGDAAVKSNLGNMRAQAAIFYDTNENYGIAAATSPGQTSCTSPGKFFALTIPIGPVDTIIAGQIAAAKAAGGGITSCMNTTISGGSAPTWAATANLKSNPTSFWCVDSNGTSRLSGVASPAATQNYADSVVAGGVCN